MPRKLDLQDFLPYLLHRTGLRVGVMFSHDIESFDVTLPMWRVLIELCHDGDYRLGELAERTSIDLSTLSRLLVSMQRRGLIVRGRSGLDGRALSLRLTQRGLELTERIVPYALHYEHIAMQHLNSRDIATLKKLLKTVYANLHAAGEPAPRKPAVQSGRRAKRPRKSVKAST